MKKLQSCIKQHSGDRISLGEQDSVKKLIQAAHSYGIAPADEIIKELISELKTYKQENRSDADSLMSGMEFSQAETANKSRNTNALKGDICAILAEHCGPISTYLFDQAANELGTTKIEENIVPIVERLSKEIDQPEEKENFLSKCFAVIKST